MSLPKSILVVNNLAVRCSVARSQIAACNVVLTTCQQDVFALLVPIFVDKLTVNAC